MIIEVIGLSSISTTEAITECDIKRWWRENYKKSLKEMRIEVLKWRIEREEQIGIPTDNIKNAGRAEKFMAELKAKLAEIEAGQNPEW